jgi:hypothetical protein
MCFYLPKTSVCVVMMCTSRDESARDQCQLPMGPLERKAGMWKHRADVTGMNTVARRHQRTTRSAASTPHWSTERFRLRETPPMPSPRHGAETRGLWRWRRSSWALALAGPVQVVPVARTKPPAGQPPVPGLRQQRARRAQPTKPTRPSVRMSAATCRCLQIGNCCECEYTRRSGAVRGRIAEMRWGSGGVVATEPNINANANANANPPKPPHPQRKTTPRPVSFLPPTHTTTEARSTSSGAHHTHTPRRGRVNIEVGALAVCHGSGATTSSTTPIVFGCPAPLPFASSSTLQSLSLPPVTLHCAATELGERAVAGRRGQRVLRRARACGPNAPFSLE